MTRREVEQKAGLIFERLKRLLDPFGIDVIMSRSGSGWEPDDVVLLRSTRFQFDAVTRRQPGVFRGLYTLPDSDIRYRRGDVPDIVAHQIARSILLETLNAQEKELSSGLKEEAPTA